jgi:flagellar biosynthetic protein FliR
VSVAAEFWRPQIALAALEAARLSGVVAVSPIPWTNAPQRVRVGLVVVLLAAVHGQGDSPVREMESAGWVATEMFTELIVGVSIGMVVRFAIATAEITGSAVSMPMGFGASQAFDPTSGTSDTVLTRVFRLLAMLLAVSIGLHRVMLGTLLSSFRYLPVGTAHHLEATFPIFLELSSHVLLVGMQIALPLFSILLMANVALGFVSRAAPSMQIFNVGFAVLLATGAAVTLLSLPDLGQEVVSEFRRDAVYFERLIGEFSAP